MSPNRPPNPARRKLIRSALSLAVRIAPPSGDVDDPVDALGLQRHRKINLLPFDFGDTPWTGCWIATARSDYVVFPKDASAAERAMVICHELAHMLLDHVPHAAEQQAQLLSALAAPTVDPAIARRFLARHGYTEEIEAEAELLGTRLVTELNRLADASTIAGDTVSDRLR